MISYSDILHIRLNTIYANRDIFNVCRSTSFEVCAIALKIESVGMLLD